MSRLNRASQRWYPDGRTAQLWLGASLVLQGLFQTAFNFDEDSSWALLVFLPMVPLGVATIVISRLTRVEATGMGFRIVKPPSRARAIPWRDIDDIRPDQPHAWATKLVVVLHDGEVVSLPLPISVHKELVDFWEHERA